MATGGWTGTRLTGRGRELDRLVRVLDSVTTGSARAIVLEGEAGIGKTRLAAELGAYASARGFEVGWGRADQVRRDRPFGPLVEALGIEVDSADPDRSRLASLLSNRHEANGPAFAANVPELRYLVIEGIGALVERLAHETPLLLVLDDLHWVDESTLQTLAAVVARTTDIPLVVLAAARTAPRPAAVDRTMDALAASGAERVALGPLDNESALHLAEEVLGARPGAALQTMVARAGGNPLFVVELAERVRGDGRLAEVTSGHSPSSELAAGGFRRRALERLNDLGEHTSLVVQVGAVLGDGFGLTEVEGVSGLPMSSLVPAVDEARRAGLVADRGTAWHFRHDLLREAVYEGIPVAIRAALHHRAGQVLAETGGGAGRVARHVALGARPGDGSAVEWLQRAARQAGASAPADALDLLRQALALAAPEDPRRGQLVAEEVKLLGWTGQLDECEALARGALQDATHPSVRATLHRHLALCVFLRNDAQEAAAVCDASTKEQHDEGARARSQSEAALAYLAAANSQAAADRAEAAVLAASSAGDATTTCLGQSVLSRLDAFGLDFVASLDRADMAVVVAADDPTGEAAHQQPAFFRLLSLLDLDRLDDAAAELEDQRRRIATLGTSWAVPLYHGVAAVVHLFRGRLDDARVETVGGLASVDDVGSPLATIWLHGAKAMTEIHMGDLDVAERTVAEAKELMAVNVALLGLDLLVLADAHTLELRGDRRGALETLTEAWELFGALGLRGNHRLIGMDLALLASSLGEEPLASSMVEALTDIAETTALASDIGAMCLARGLHRHDTVAVLDGVAAYERSGRPLALARACEEAGRMLWSDGRRETAATLLDRSNLLYEEAGALGSVRRIAGLFSALGLRRPRARPRPASGWASLTASEQRIAALVGDGLTNQAIADRLGISRRTVETHLTHVYAKLALRTRVELALEASRRPPPV